jgi:hypothetical protein
MKSFARGINRKAFITCNNSLNSPDAFFAQCRHFAYDIEELSRTEDWITVEDMATQPRLLPDGRTIEYGPIYRMLGALAHGKPVVAVTLAEADYHTPPNLVRLAMAEAAANGASYLSWPTWPENVRQKMAASIRPEADFLRRNQQFLNDIQPRSDVVVLLSFHRWLDTENCAASGVCATLARSNIQFTVVCEADAESALEKTGLQMPVLLIEQLSTLDEKERACVADWQKRGGHVLETGGTDWLNRLSLEHRAVTAEGAPNLRAMVADQGKLTLVHLYNLGIERLSSFEDKVHSVEDARVYVHVPFARVKSVTALTVDDKVTSGPLDFKTRAQRKETVVEVTIPRIEIATMLKIEGR